MDLNDFSTQLATVANYVKSKEKFLSGSLAAKAKKVAENFPYDMTSVDMYHFLQRKAEKQPLITRQEIKEAYDQLYTKDNQFSKIFANELGVVQEKTTVTKKASVEEDLLKNYADKTADPFLKNAFSTLFESSKPAKLYSEDSATNALRNTKFELEKIKLSPHDLEIVAGNENALICRAGFQTPKGDVSVLIPVKTADNNLYFPTTFIGSAGLKELNYDNLSKHIVDNAGKFLKIDATVLLNHISKHATPLSEVEEAVVKSKLNSLNQSAYNNLGIVYKEGFIPEGNSVKDIKMDLPAPLTPFVEQLGSVAGQAEFLFGKTAVDAGRDYITRKLNSFGHKQFQIKVASLRDQEVTYIVNLLNKAFTVPVKIANKQAQEPKFLVVNGSPKAINANSIQEVINSATDAQALLQSSVWLEASTGELVKRLQNSLYEGNLKTASELLQVLSQKDIGSFQAGLELYKKALAGEKIYKNASCGCPATVRSQNSSQPLCSHTGLPVNKVYQDKFGACRPLYRRAFEETANSRPEFLHVNTLIWNDK